MEQQESVEVTVGRIGKPHGLRGEVTIDVRTDEPERRFADGAELIVNAPRGSAFTLPRLTVTKTRQHQGIWLVSFAEIPDRTAAEVARGVTLHVHLDPAETPEDPEEYYDHQLVGLDAVDLEGNRLGTVRAVNHSSAQDLIVIRTPDGRDALVPFVAALVPEVDLEQARIVVADRPGLVTPFPDDEG